MTRILTPFARGRRWSDGWYLTLSGVVPLCGGCAAQYALSGERVEHQHGIDPDEDVPCFDCSARMYGRDDTEE